MSITVQINFPVVESAYMLYYYQYYDMCNHIQERKVNGKM